MQVPYLFFETRWFFLVCGYGAGKTKANVFALLYAVKRLQGRKDRSGDHARLMVAGYTLAHLNKTFLVYLRQILDQSKTPYTENKKDNFFVIGTVTVFVVPMENPENIFGMDVFAIYVEEADELTEDKAVEATRALSERCRQQIPEERSPFLCLGSTSQGQKGLYRIYNHFKKSGTGFVLIRGRTEDNPFLPDALIRDMKKMYSPEEKCLDYDTPILTMRNGVVCHTRIGRLSAGCRVFTRDGWQSVLKVRFTGQKPAMRLGSVRLTPDHRVLDNGEWVEAKDARNITYYDEKEILLWTYLEELRTNVRIVRQRLLSTMANGGTGTRNRLYVEGIETITGAIRKWMEGVKVSIFTTTYGKKRMAGCLKVLSCIISTKIRLITLCRICWRFQEKYINSFTYPMTACGSKGSKGLRVGAARWAKQRRVSAAVKSLLRSILTLATASRANLPFIGRMWSGENRKELDTVLERLYALYVGKSLSSPTPELLSSVLTSAEAVLQGMAFCVPGSTSVPVLSAGSSLGLIGQMVNTVPINAVRGTAMKNRRLVDIEISTRHEFVADGMVVHNCVFMDGEFLSIAKGRVLGDFNWERNYLDYDLDTELSPNETVMVAQDFNTGYSRASAYVVRDGVIYCIKYYDFSSPQDAPSVFRHDFQEQRILWIPDVTIKDSFPQFARELRKYRIQIIYRKKNPLVEDTVFLVNKLFYTGRLMMCKITKDLAEMCALAMRDKDNKVPKGIGPSSPIHGIDTIRYACSFICMRDRAFRDIRELIIDKRASFRPDSEKLVQDLGSGYTQIHPDALYHGKKL
jgi:hypothetical protein